MLILSTEFQKVAWYYPRNFDARKTPRRAIFLGFTKAYSRFMGPAWSSHYVRYDSSMLCT
jgi:hypothetical protein